MCESGLRVAARAINFECAREGERGWKRAIQRTDERIRRDGIIVPPSASRLLFQNLNKYRLEVGRSSSPRSSSNNEQTPATELFNYRRERYPIVVPRLSSLVSKPCTLIRRLPDNYQKVIEHRSNAVERC